MFAAARAAPVTGTVAEDPDNYYEYADAYGRTQRVQLPRGTLIVEGSSIEFQPNGSVTSESRTIIEADLGDDDVERWTIDTNRIGVTTVEHARIQ